ncbi:ribonuclease P protein subunit p30-like [Homarus americanus]|uniref:Ribonuclease P protein subunit p30-like n=1 Tax=Homarus americanus TaxID=6706 RepID=A0A8J5MZR7_HOMAM|nr:ribonuclease P protein subunit p30-like [Homarus americanus]KAG7169147.1 Ribonuclease P protein subunit p30-like [Homarus americanus]
MKLARGFCDLNISASDEDLKNTVLKALSIGYQTVAINREVIDNSTSEKKKRKKGDFPMVPPPPKLELSEEDLRQHGITREPVILTRITVTYSDPGSAFLSKFREVIKQYDIIAFTPTTEGALKQTVCQTLVDVDIISLNPNEQGARFARKLLRLAVERDIYFELSYGPCILNSGSRQRTITLSHILHQCSRSANIIVTSQARVPSHLRHPYDVMNLGRFFGLTEGAAKQAIVSLSHNVVYCAASRRKGAAKCVAQVTFLDTDTPKSKFDGLGNARKFLKTNTGISD